MYMHAYTLYSAVRPFGCSVILSTYTEEDGPDMYMIDPSGVSYVSTSTILYLKLKKKKIILVYTPKKQKQIVFQRLYLVKKYSF